MKNILYSLFLAPGFLCGFCGCHFQVDYLFWRPCVNDVFLALSLDSSIEQITEQTDENGQFVQRFYTTLFDQDARIQQIDFEADSGFRLAVQFNKRFISWDSSISWTHFHPNTTRSIRTDNNDFTATLSSFGGYELSLIDQMGAFNFFQIGQVLFPTNTKVSGDWKLDLDLIDFSLRRDIGWSSLLLMDCFIGLRAGWIDQELTLRTEGEFNTSAVVPVQQALFTYRERLMCDFTGIGPRLGTEGRYCVGCGFSLFGHLAASMLYGERHANNFQKGSRFDSIDPQLDSDDFHEKIHKSKWCTQLVTDLHVGLSWCQSLFCDCLDVDFSLGWEHHYLHGLSPMEVELVNEFVSEESSDLSFHGLTLSAKVGF